jgi:hypothetical protein
VLDSLFAVFDGKRPPSNQRANAYNSRGIAYAEKGQRDRAIQDFKNTLGSSDDRNAGRAILS